MFVTNSGQVGCDSREIIYNILKQLKLT